MKIAICGSMQFAKEMIELKENLEGKGHKVEVPINTQKYVNGEVKVEDKWEKQDLDVFKDYFKKIKYSDAVLIINEVKNGTEGYVGGNSLIEMAFAHILDKKIFLLRDIPKMSYTDEIEAMKPVVLNGNLNLII